MTLLNHENGELKENEIVVLGVPFDSNSSYRRGPASAPGKIKAALFSESSNMWTENLVDLGALSGWQFKPDMHLSD